MNGTFAFDSPRPRPPRRPSLTPMVDVVFLLLVFFMLAARFGVEGRLSIALTLPGQGAAWQGPPRLVEVTPAGLRLNGRETDAARLPAALAALMPGPEAPVLLRPVEGADLERLAEVIGLLAGAGLAGLAVVE